MAQAARCPHCQTTFRVVRDQLLLREGWVRCGHCGEPFNALDHLIEISPPVPQPEPEIAPQVEPELIASPPLPPVAEEVADVAAEPPAQEPDWMDPARRSLHPPSSVADPAFPLPPLPLPTRAPASEGEPEVEPTPHIAESGNETDFTDSRTAPQLVLHEGDARAELSETAESAPHPVADARDGAADAEPLSAFNLSDALNYRFDTEPVEGGTQAAAGTAIAATTAEPEFLRSARRQAAWRSRPVQIALGFASLVLLLTLALQAAWFWRDSLAQTWPATRPWLQQLCNLTTGCQLAAPRNIDALVIDSSSLTPAGQELMLSVLLRNRIDRAVAYPALELTLTDLQGKIDMRKVLEPAQYLAPSQADAAHIAAGLPAGQQIQLRLRLQTPGPAPSGYRLYLFYP